jgi:hypothetical protein
MRSQKASAYLTRASEVHTRRKTDDVTNPDIWRIEGWAHRVVSRSPSQTALIISITRTGYESPRQDSLFFFTRAGRSWTRQPATVLRAHL